MKTRIIIFIISLLTYFSAMAQKEIIPTNFIQITGKIKAEKTYSLANLDSFPKIILSDQIIYNHKGEIKDTLKNIRGVSLKTILNSIELIYEKPKNLNEFYFVMKASDGYKVVLSWNEIYNMESGNNFFIITEMGGKKLAEMNQRIMFLATTDLKSGRRYIKGLEKIEVKQVD